jgi:hypothetical protein
MPKVTKQVALMNKRPRRKKWVRKLLAVLKLEDPDLNADLNPVGMSFQHISKHSRKGNHVTGVVEEAQCRSDTCRANAVSQAILHAEIPESMRWMRAVEVGHQLRVIHSLLMPSVEALRDLLGPFIREQRMIFEAHPQPIFKHQTAEFISAPECLLRTAAQLEAEVAALPVTILSAVPREYQPKSLGTKRPLHLLDDVTLPLLPCFSNREIADLIDDGRKDGDPVARVSARRLKLTGTKRQPLRK